MSTFVAAIVFILGSILLSIGGFYLLTKKWPDVRHEANNDLMQLVFLMISGLYGVLLAFVVIIIWGDFSAAKQNVQQEVTSLNNVMRSAGGFTPQSRIAVRNSVLVYVNDVINDEYPALARGQASVASQDTFDQIWTSVSRAAPQTGTGTQFVSNALSEMSAATAHRGDRIESSTATVPPILWILTGIGGLLTIVMLYFFWVEKIWIHYAAITALAGLLGFIVFLIFSLEHPFAGSVHVSPQAFHDFVREWTGHV